MSPSEPQLLTQRFGESSSLIHHSEVISPYPECHKPIDDAGVRKGICRIPILKTKSCGRKICSALNGNGVGEVNNVGTETSCYFRQVLVVPEVTTPDTGSYDYRQNFKSWIMDFYDA